MDDGVHLVPHRSPVATGRRWPGARHRETSFVAAVSGPANLAANVLCAGLDHLYRYVTSELGGFPVIREAEASPDFERMKQTGSLMRAASRLVAHLEPAKKPVIRRGCCPLDRPERFRRHWVA